MSDPVVGKNKPHQTPHRYKLAGLELEKVAVLVVKKTDGVIVDVERAYINHGHRFGILH